MSNSSRRLLLGFGCWLSLNIRERKNALILRGDCQEDSLGSRKRLAARSQGYRVLRMAQRFVQR